MAVLDRVDVDVIHVTGEVVFTADQVFPEAALPDAALAFLVASSVDVFADGNAT